MAKISCLCGYIHARLPESGSVLLPWAIFDALDIAAHGGETYPFEVDRWRDVSECPNCGRIALQDADGWYSFFTPDNSVPRVYVDRSVRDALGGYGLEDPRTIRELAVEKVILNPATGITVYDDTDWTAECTIEPWVNEDDTLSDDRFVAREGHR